MSRFWSGVVSLLLVAACAPIDERRADSVPVEPLPPRVEEVPPASAPDQWVQFGMVLSASETEVVNPEGGREPGQMLHILFDSGETMDVAQPLSQAGRLSQGDRVRVLRIGGFTRVTFWPYGNFSPRQ